MKHFTIDTDNNITVHSSKQAARDTGAAVFASEVQLADLIGPDNKRLVEIWNGLPGVKSVAKFANRKVATERIWKAIQGLGEAAAAPWPVREVEAPVPAQPEAAPSLQVATEANAGLDPSQAATAAEMDTILPAEVSEPAISQAEPEVPETVAAAEPVAIVGAQAPDVAPADKESSKKAGRARKAPKVPKVAAADRCSRQLS